MAKNLFKYNSIFISLYNIFNPESIWFEVEIFKPNVKIFKILKNIWEEENK